MSRIGIFFLIYLFCCFSSLKSQHWNVQTILPPTHVNTAEFYGFTVATYGNLAAIGVPGNSESGYKVGYVQLVKKSINGWIELAKLRPSLQNTNTQPWFNFGSVIAMDSNKVAVGYIDSHSKNNTGAVYLFEKPNGGWENTTETAILTSSDGQPGDFFGKSIALDNDRIVIGAPENNDGGPHVGAVYIFEQPASGWVSMTETIKIPSPHGGYSYFGSSLDIEDNTLMIGHQTFVPWTDNPIVVYEKESGNWIQVATISKFDDPYDNIVHFGNFIKLKDNQLFINVTKYAGNGQFRILVFILEKGASGWSNYSLKATLQTTETFPSSSTGFKFDVSENGVACAVNDRLYIFDKPSTGWTDSHENSIINAEEMNEELALYFSWSMALGDNFLFIGQPANSDSGYYNGAVEIYEKLEDGWANPELKQQLFPQLYVSNIYDHFGHAVDVYNDIAVVSSFHMQDNGSGKRSVFLYKNFGDKWVRIAELMPPKPSRSYCYGYSVSINKDLVAVSAPGNSLKSHFLVDTTGFVYLFEKPQGGWEDMMPTAVLSPSEGGNKLDKFGYSVDIYDDKVLIGAPYEFQNAKAYIYERPTDGWSNMTETQVFDSPLEDYYVHNFGTAVAIDGDELVVSGNSTIFIYQRFVEGWEGPIAELNCGDNNLLGDQLEFLNNVIVGGVPKHQLENSSLYTAAAYVYVKQDSGWLNTSLAGILLSSDTTKSSHYEYDMGFNGDRVIFYPGGEMQNVYLFSKPESGWSHFKTPYLHEDTIITQAFNNLTVALDRNDIFIGIPNYGSMQESGAVIVYRDPSAFVPDDLSITVESNTELTLDWKYFSNDTASFEVYRSDNDSVGFIVIDTVRWGNFSYTDQNLSTGQKYYYKLKAFNSFGSSSFSSTVQAIPGIAPETPYNLNIVIGENNLFLSWEAKGDSSVSFAVYRSDAAANNFEIINTTSWGNFTYTDQNLVNGQEYFYKIRAFNPFGDSPFSSVVRATPGLPPGSPKSLSIASAISTGIYLFWNNNFTDVTGTVIQRSLYDNDKFTTIDTVSSETNEYTDEDIEMEQLFIYRVYTFNEFGASGYSNEVSAIVSGVDSSIKEQVEIYPNPAKDWLKISAKKQFSPLSATVKDLSGKKLEEWSIYQVDDTESVQIDISNLKSGTYIVIISTQDSTKCFKLNIKSN